MIAPELLMPLLLSLTEPASAPPPPPSEPTTTPTTPEAATTPTTPATTEPVATSAPTPPSAVAPEATPSPAPPPATPAVAATTPATPWFVAGDLRVAPRANFRVRGEVIGDRTLQGLPSTTPVTHRFRLGATVQAGEHVEGVFEVQDVRMWGSELPAPELPPDPTVYGAVENSVDLHQAWIALKAGTFGELRVGRQEISIGNERLIGAVDFVQRARSFDAVRFVHKDDATVVNVVGAILADADAGPASLGDRGMAFVSVEHALAPWLKLSPIAVYDDDQNTERQRGTGGVRVDGKASGFAYDVEGYGQATSMASVVSYGWLAGARASYGFDTVLHPRVGGLVDVVSGTDDGLAHEGGLAPFDTLYATNHRFYGAADLFLNLPLHTKGHGLIDLAPVLWSSEGPLSLVATTHVFLPYAAPAAATSPLYGVEPDLVVTLKPWAGLSLEGGGGVFVPVGDALGRGLNPGTPEATQARAAWLYAQLAYAL